MQHITRERISKLQQCFFNSLKGRDRNIQVQLMIFYTVLSIINIIPSN